MVYKHLPPVGAFPLPELEWLPTEACSPRVGTRVEDIWVHRWGGGTCSGVCNWFSNPGNGASAHIVYAGETGPEKGRCVQMVKLADAAWTEAKFNREGVSVEMADAIWLGHDPEGFARAARIVGWLLLHEKLPAAWVRDPHTHQHGITRHADGGQDAGGHYVCPTTDTRLFEQFLYRVKHEIAYSGQDGYRTRWAR